MGAITVEYRDGEILGVTQWDNADQAMIYATLAMAASIAHEALTPSDAELADSLHEVWMSFDSGADMRHWENLYEEMRETAAMKAAIEVVVDYLHRNPDGPEQEFEALGQRLDEVAPIA